MDYARTVTLGQPLNQSLLPRFKFLRIHEAPVAFVQAERLPGWNVFVGPIPVGIKTVRSPQAWRRGAPLPIECPGIVTLAGQSNRFVAAAYGDKNAGPFGVR